MKHRCTQRTENWLGFDSYVICESDENTGALYLSINDMKSGQIMTIQPNYCPLCGKNVEIVVDIP